LPKSGYAYSPVAPAAAFFQFSATERTHTHTIGGGRIVLLRDFLADVLQHLCRLDMAATVVPEQWGLIRTLQFVAEYRAPLAALLTQFATAESAPPDPGTPPQHLGDTEATYHG